MTIQINQRLNILGEYCTVRFIGEIPNWSSEVALGLEWDNIERGKNDGSIDGVRYFHTRNGIRSGSFMKLSSKKLRESEGYSFIRALCDKYGKGYANYHKLDDLFTVSDRNTTTITRERDTNVEEIKIGSKVVESYGFEKLDILQSNFQGLEIVSLNRCNIKDNANEFDDDKEIKINLVLPNLKVFDLSFNLLTDWKDVYEIVKLGKIESLNLNGNRFQAYNLQKVDPIRSVKKLSLAETFITEFSFLSKIFPDLEELNLAGNGLNDKYDLKDLCNLTNLKLLDLSFNNYTSVPHNELARIRKLQKLVINNNNISLKKDTIALRDVIDLDIRANLISSLDEVDLLNKLFPSLQRIRINDNPVAQSTIEMDNQLTNNIDKSTIEILVRLNSDLQNFNRTNVSVNERENYELYFISLMAKEPDLYKKFMQTGRYQQLLKAHGVNQDQFIRNDSQEIIGRLASNMIRLNVKLPDDEDSKEINTFKYYTVGNLKGIISKEILGDESILKFKISYEISTSLREYLQDDLSMIQSTGVADNETLYVEHIYSD